MMACVWHLTQLVATVERGRAARWRVGRGAHCSTATPLAGGRPAAAAVDGMGGADANSIMKLSKLMWKGLNLGWLAACVWRAYMCLAEARYGSRVWMRVTGMRAMRTRYAGSGAFPTLLHSATPPYAILLVRYGPVLASALPQLSRAIASLARHAGLRSQNVLCAALCALTNGLGIPSSVYHHHYVPDRRAPATAPARRGRATIVVAAAQQLRGMRAGGGQENACRSPSASQARHSPFIALFCLL